ncbi:MAG: ABC transporter ATP-binding protein [Planctomycetes bacterium]|nr:ABC transporter ATP-binding protein [Planctomycetota bacterium]MCB9825927.1 ABC transporter ATP-binding protein [Planctomycetota bacterium]MCB9900731.1 ABC transporter ATP-binding protein [Planctomycetota bacterium]
MSDVVRLTEARRTYRMGEEEVHALDGLDLVVPRGEYLAIMGQSGSGKSTLLNILGCLDRLTSGSYELDGKDVSRLDDDRLSHERNRRLGFVFQSYNLIPHLTVLENIEVPMEYAGIRPGEARQRSTELATRLGLGGRLKHRPSELSGGQQQRVAIARALGNDPSLMLADEPTGNLDSATGIEILDLLDTLAAEGRTLIVVTHDRKVAARAHRTIHMLDGKIAREDRRVAEAATP